jgi:hypothetical protein
MAEPTSPDGAFDMLRSQLGFLAEQLDLARAHVNTMERHLDARGLPRLAAHGFSVHGHLTRETLGEISTDWADHSQP